MKPKFVVYDINSGKSSVPAIGKFPGGEIRVKLNPEHEVGEEVRVEAMLFNSDDIMTLVMLADALREVGVTKIRLTMPYIPYARQDRVCNPGEALSMRAFARIINSLNFSSVVVYDPHSDVSMALIDRCIPVQRYTLMRQHEAMYDAIAKGGWAGNLYLVSPDAGAVKKSYEIAKYFPQFKGIIFAEKVRDTATGQIVKTVVKDLPDDVEKAHLIVCDDICDGGRTFIELAKVTRQYCDKMSLYVTHGIFSQGLDALLPYYDNVWCTVDFSEYK